MTKKTFNFLETQRAKRYAERKAAAVTLPVASQTVANLALEFQEYCRKHHISCDSYMQLQTFCAYRFTEEDMQAAYYLVTGNVVE